jgi:hypothetical protein
MNNRGACSFFLFRILFVVHSRPTPIMRNDRGSVHHRPPPSRRQGPHARRRAGVDGIAVRDLVTGLVPARLPGDEAVLH